MDCEFFLDYQELQEGEEFPRQIKSAISAASLHVAIFSPKYADSQWCLEELVLMLESGTPIIPVFHHVKPTELRRTDGEGVYATSLRNLEKKKRKSDSQPRYDSETIENWRNALSRVADISGLDLEACNGDEGELVDKIVAAVLRKPVKTPLHVATYPTGLAEKVQDFETKVLLQQCSGRVQIVGIAGLGGVGKTTLALELFNRKRSNYRNSYFFSDVRENAKKSLDSLQRQLLHGLFQLELHIENRHAGIEKVKKHLSSCKFLLVLDDVDHQGQVFALLPQLNDLHHDSLILITSRDKDVLVSSGVQKSSIYQLSGLNTQHSRELFRSHAFGRPDPISLDFEDLVDDFVRACHGLPLSLEFFGRRLHGESEKSYWKNELEEFRKRLPCDIQKSLQISYDALEEEEKQIFLDIACFFIRERRDTAIIVWDGSGWNGSRGFRSLLDKCLVELNDYDQIIMHDHLINMGRDLAKSSGLPCRLWCGIEDLLQQSFKAPRVRGIKMVRGDHLTIRPPPRSLFYKWFGPQPLTLIKNLQLLKISGISDDLLKCLLEGVDSPNLLWFCWNNCRCSSLPPYIPMKNLRVLDVHGNELETLWQEDLQAPLQLRELWIRSDRFSKIPNSIGQLKHLERMVMQSSLDFDIPKELCYLHSLKHLVLDFNRHNGLYCESPFGGLKRLPDSFGNLSRLEHFELSECRGFESLPDSFGNLSSLKYIRLDQCRALVSLPDSFGNLSMLEHIHLSQCWGLKRLPDSFGNLSMLESFDLTSCNGLKRLPDSIGDLSRLERINLSFCMGLERLPDSFCNLSMLKHIHLSHCTGLKMLPDAFGNLSRLEYINFNFCSSLERLPDSFGNLSRLEHIDFSPCSSLERLPDSFGNLSRLERINFNFCSSLERLPDSFGNLSRLERIDLYKCIRLQRLPESFGNLCRLERIDLSHCIRLERLPDSFGNLSRLERISLYGCSEDSFGNLSRRIYIDWNPAPVLSVKANSPRILD